MPPTRLRLKLPLLALLTLWLLVRPPHLAAQDNYEIQVYPSETVAAGATMFELHSNFTVKGLNTGEDGSLSSHHALHETVEITHGWTDWFETGVYIFTSARHDTGWDWVGDHIRPRISAPKQWNLPVGLSLSAEIGYMRRLYSPDTWSLEIRPIIDKQWGKMYLALNPALGRSLHGAGTADGFIFSPNIKGSYAFLKRVSGGLEYYGSLGPVTGFSPVSRQQHTVMPAIDLDLGPEWEFNFGVGIGLTGSTDHLIVKMIVGRRDK